MSAILATKKAAEQRLATLGIPTAYENAEFTPVASQEYIRVQFVIQSPDDPVLGDRYYRENIQLQVFVCGLLNKGTASAITTAESIRALFAKGWSTQEGIYRISNFSTPKISGTAKTSDRLVVPLLIDLITEVNL